MIFVSSLSARIANRLGLIRIFRVGYTIQILKSTFKIPVIENKEGFRYHLTITEAYMLSVLQHLYNTIDFLFLDVGVNFGQTLLKVKAINPKAFYIGFEPSGLCSYYSSHLIKINQMTDAQVIRCALCDNPEMLTLYAKAEGDTMASILDTFIAKERVKVKEYIPGVTLDSLISIITSIGKEIILKVDVEGAEWIVFQGGEAFISQFRPVIIFECLTAGEDILRQQQQQAISAFLLGKGFELYLLNESTALPEKISVIDNKADGDKTNYLAIPSEKVHLFSKLLNNSLV